MAAVASIQITVDANGAVSAINNLKGQVTEIEPAFQKVGQTSNVILTQMVKDHDHARESARLLREETGIFLPRALQGLIAQSQILGPVLNSAFSVFAIVGFIEVLASIPKHIGAVIESMTHQKAATEAITKAHEELRKVWEETAKEQQSFQLQLDLIGKTGSEKIAAEAAAAHQLANIEAGRLSTLQAMKAAQESLIQRDEEAARKAAGVFAPGAGKSSTQRDQEAAGAQLNTLVAQQKLAFDKANDAATKLDLQYKQTWNEEQQKHIDETTKKIEAQQKALRDADTASLLEGNHSLDQIIKKNDQRAKADEKFVADSQKDIDAVNQEIGKYYSDQLKTEDHLAQLQQKRASEAEKQAEETQRAWTQARDHMANSIDTFFTDITSGNLGKSFLKQFEKMVSQMVATWVMGMRGMSTSTAGAQGGGIFNFANQFTGPEADMLGVPLSGGGGGGDLSLSTLPAGGSTVGGIAQQAGGFGGLAGLFKGAGMMNLLSMGGILGGMQLLGSQNTAIRTAGGFLTGGFGGLEAGSALASLGIISPLVAFAGPIGAIAGALFGLFSGIFGHGKQKVQQTHVLQGMQHELDLLQRAYDVHQIDYNSAISQAEQMRQNYIQQQEQIQKGGGPSRVNPWIDAFERHIYDEEKQRQNALAAAARYGPPQFRYGGFVDGSLSRVISGFTPAMHFAAGGAVPAMLHAGEFVMRPEAVQRIGRSRLEVENRGGDGFGGVHVQLTVNALEPRSFEEYLNGEGGRALARSIQRAVAEGRM